MDSGWIQTRFCSWTCLSAMIRFIFCLISFFFPPSDYPKIQLHIHLPAFINKNMSASLCFSISNLISKAFTTRPSSPSSSAALVILDPPRARIHQPAVREAWGGGPAYTRSHSKAWNGQNFCLSSFLPCWRPCSYRNAGYLRTHSSLHPSVVLRAGPILSQRLIHTLRRPF